MMTRDQKGTRVHTVSTCIRELDQNRIQNVKAYNGNNKKGNQLHFSKLERKIMGSWQKPKKLNVQKMFFNGDFISAT